MTNSIILNYFNPKRDARLESMMEFGLRTVCASTKCESEVLLMDGAGFPSERVSTVCGELGAKYLPSNSREGFAETYNRGLSIASGDYLTLMASDIFPCPGWDERLISELNRTKAWMAIPYLSYSDYYSQIGKWVVLRRTFKPNFLTFNLNMVTRKCLDGVGKLDSQFTGNFNDLDYYARIQNAGGTVIVSDAGEILHLGHATLSVVTDSNWIADRAAFNKKHPRFTILDDCIGANPMFCSSRIYATILKLAGCMPKRLSRRLRTQLTRLEPIFHRI